MNKNRHTTPLMLLSGAAGLGTAVLAAVLLLWKGEADKRTKTAAVITLSVTAVVTFVTLLFSFIAVVATGAANAMWIINAILALTQAAFFITLAAITYFLPGKITAALKEDEAADKAEEKPEPEEVEITEA